MIKNFLFAVAMITVISGYAQEGGTASPYSFYGIGTQQFRGTVENKSMGGISIYSDSLHLNLQNPASLGKLRFVTYTVGGNHSEVAVKDAANEEKTSSSTFDYLALGFPISKKMGVSFGLMPFTSVGYRLDDSTEEVLNRFEGRGGVNRVFLSTGYKVTKGLTVGATVNYNFGNIQNETLRSQDGIELGTRERNRSDLLGFTFNLGAQYEYEISDKLDFTASVGYVPASKITSENTRQVSSVLFNNLGLVQDLDTRDIVVADSDFDFPATTTLGVGLGKRNKWFLGAEYTSKQTSNFTNRTFILDNVSFEDATQYRLGGFYTPKYNSVSSYLQRVTYRAGFRYEESGIVINSEDINEFGISFGVGLPAGRYISNANIGIEYGQRGTTDANLIQEDFFNFSLSFSLNDTWFRKTKFN